MGINSIATVEAMPVKRKKTLGFRVRNPLIWPACQNRPIQNEKEISLKFAFDFAFLKTTWSFGAKNRRSVVKHRVMFTARSQKAETGISIKKITRWQEGIQRAYKVVVHVLQIHKVISQNKMMPGELSGNYGNKALDTSPRSMRLQTEMSILKNPSFCAVHSKLP